MPDRSSKAPGRLVPGTAIAVVLAGFVLVPAYLLSRPQYCGNRVLKCATQVRNISRALLAYADQNGGALPPAGDTWADLLIASGHITAEDLVSPMALQGERCSYAYVPAARLDPRGSQALLYEPADLHPDYGVHVAYHDGRVETLSAEDAGAIIARIETAEPIPTFPAIDWDAFKRSLTSGKP
jgi:hypothetical protein